MNRKGIDPSCKRKLNCWEFIKCGREPKGKKTKELGVCPAALDERLNGFHEGKNAGRVCWAIAGTFCEGKVHGIFAGKNNDCTVCDFFRQVKAEEGPNYRSIKAVQHARDKRIEEILDGLNCPKNIACYNSEKDGVCKAKDIGLESFLVCLENDSKGCKFLLEFEDDRFCQCPLRVYIAKKKIK